MPASTATEQGLVRQRLARSSGEYLDQAVSEICSWLKELEARTDSAAEFPHLRRLAISCPPSIPTKEIADALSQRLLQAGATLQATLSETLCHPPAITVEVASLQVSRWNERLLPCDGAQKPDPLSEVSSACRTSGLALIATFNRLEGTGLWMERAEMKLLQAGLPAAICIVAPDNAIASMATEVETDRIVRIPDPRTSVQSEREGQSNSAIPSRGSALAERLGSILAGAVAVGLDLFAAVAEGQEQDRALVLDCAVLSMYEPEVVWEQVAPIFLAGHQPSLAGDGYSWSRLGQSLQALLLSVSQGLHGSAQDAEIAMRHLELARRIWQRVDSCQDRNQLLWKAYAAHCAAASAWLELHKGCCEFALRARDRGDHEAVSLWRAKAESAWHSHNCGQPKSEPGAIAESPYLLRLRAYLQSDCGDYEGGLAMLNSATAAISRNPDEILVGTLFADKGNLLMYAGALDDAAAAFDSADLAFRHCGEERRRGIVLANAGIIRHHQGRLEDARRLYEEGLALSKRLANARAEAGVVSYLAKLYLDMGRLELARSTYERYLQLAQQAGDRNGEAIALEGLGNICREAGEYVEGEQYYRASIELSKRLSNDKQSGSALANLARLRKMTGNIQGGLDAAAMALDRLNREDAPVDFGYALAEYGDLQRLAGQTAEAVETLRTAADFLDQCGMDLFYGVALCYLAMAYSLLGDNHNSIDALARAAAVHAALGSREELDLAPALRTARVFVSSEEN